MPECDRTWGAARVVVGVSDRRGLRGATPIEFAGARHEFAPGANVVIAERGVHAIVGRLDVAEARTHQFSFSLELAGSEMFSFAPLARDASFAMTADWPHPSFFGPFLPARREIRNNRFAATWRVSQFASQGASRVAACASEKNCRASAEVLGVSFVEPVGGYQLLDRATKYGFFFIGLLLATFFLLELLRQLAIHPIQYALVATIACVGIVTIYVVRVLHSTLLGGAFGAGLAGALLLFALLAAVMVATRRVDWYRLT
ncbi:MAG: inner membrane CreD family protein, partial [Burkholderiales bacterium]